MANLRDGGIIVIGVSERGQEWALDGISDDDLATYDVDPINDKINAFASPYIQADFVLVKHQDKQFLAMQFDEFLETPIVCKKNGNCGLAEGGIYVRPPGKAQTTRVMNSIQMHDLLQLSAEKRARRIIEVGKAVGLEPEQSATQSYDKELEGFV